MSLPSVMRPPGMAVGKAPAGLPDHLQSLAALLPLGGVDVEA